MASPHNTSAQQATIAPEVWAKDMTRHFRRVLSTKRMNALAHKPSATATSSSQTRSIGRYGGDGLPPSGPPSSAPRKTSALRNIPITPTAPTDRSSLRFRSLLHSLANVPMGWENPGLLDDALRYLPLERIYEEAQEESDTYEAEAATLPKGTKPAWGYQDCVVIALMRWFKRDFFKWINNPECSKCGSPTIATGMAAPTPDEQACSATRVELYSCSHASCNGQERFPRYSDAAMLLKTRRGRVGEWANCFSMLCRAIGSRVRWVWNSEDHVWTEVYSAHRRRWVHVDACEGVWDQPLLYTQGLSLHVLYSSRCTDMIRVEAKTRLLCGILGRWCCRCHATLRAKPASSDVAGQGTGSGHDASLERNPRNEATRC